MSNSYRRRERNERRDARLQWLRSHRRLWESIPDGWKRGDVTPHKTRVFCGMQIAGLYSGTCVLRDANIQALIDSVVALESQP